MNGITFTVSDTTASMSPLPIISRDQHVRQLLKKRVEALYTSKAHLVSCADENPFVKAAHDAFYHHYPLVISPDTIWFCLAQGFAHHVGLHAEELRQRIVTHHGKVKVVVVRADFDLGKENPWPEAFATFSAQLAKHLGSLHDRLAVNFSTTGPIERSAFAILLMDTFQPYFEYEMFFGCGIPSITLLGTVDDWESLREHIVVFAEFGLEDWVNTLSPILDQLVMTSQGHPDRNFWRSFFRYKSTSYGSELTGWIHVLFPYLLRIEESDSSDDVFTGQGRRALVPNPYMKQWWEAWHTAEARFSSFLEQMREHWPMDFSPEGPQLSAIPSGLARAPVKLVDMRTGAEYQMQFVGGMFGVVQASDTLALCPEFGWAVVYDT